MSETRDPSMLIIRHAVENASNEPITDAGILAILRGNGGTPSHLRAVFGDVSLAAISRAGAAGGITFQTIFDAYRVARESVAAANPELDEALKANWQAKALP
jgi:hypothetical protein